MLETPFTKLVGCSAPIQLAPIGGLELAAAVARAGGLGMYGSPMATPDQIAALLERLAAAADGGVIGVNFLIPAMMREAVEVASSRARVVEFFYGEPDPALIKAAHDGGALACWQTGSLDETKAAVDAGCDLVVVQGVEAGGHVRGTVGLLALLDLVVDKTDVPLIAAGGITTARAMAAALAAGASAVRVGTRFLAASESDAHPLYVDAILRASSEDTVLTEAFHVLWPDAPHRVLRSAVERAEALTDDVVGEMSMGDMRVPVSRFSAAPPHKDTTGEIEAMALYAGQGVGAVTRVQPAADIVRELCAGAEELLKTRR